MDPKRLVVIDGYSLLYRAFFATRFLSTSDGRPTNALHGFTGMLFHLLEHVRPHAIVVALDAPGKTFRHAAYAEYKGTRRETPPELKVQFPEARNLINAMGIPCVEVPTFEADDVVGTISRLGEENGYLTTIVTGDLDSLQLVDDHVSVLTTQRGVTDTITYDVARVYERYGFGPELVPDYKAICGDSSDNIPGVPGIGDKGASAILQQFGTIENVLARFDELDPKYQKKIEPAKEQMIKSKWLATIKRDVPLEYDFEPFVLDDNEFAAARAVLESFELRTAVRRMDLVLGPYREGAAPRSEAPAVVVEEALEVKVSEASSAEQLIAWVGDRPFALAFEQSGEQGSMFDEPQRTAFVAVGNEVRRGPEALGVALLEVGMGRAIVHDAKPLYAKLAPTLVPPRFDTMLAAYVLQSGRSQYALRDLIQGYTEFGAPTSAPQIASALWHLEKTMGERLDKESQRPILDTIELPLVPILAEMERFGIATSGEYLLDFSKSLEVDIDRQTRLIYEMAGEEFNIGSPKQLGELLFDKMGLPGPKRTKTGYATGVEVLQVLAPAHPICSEVLSWRELSKLKSTYADALPRMIREDGRIHTTYAQTVAATGRLSSNEPNLQNIPIRTELGRRIRHAFVAAPGYRLAAFDYSQIELRVLAHMCKDDALVSAFQRHEDVHAVTASLMYSTPLSEVTREMRGYSKMLNYAVLYGVTDFGLASQLGGAFSLSEAKGLIEQYRERFPKIKAFTDSVVAEAKSKGFTTTLSGRRRHFPDIHALNRNERMYAERQAMNAPLQGTAADMIKLAMIDVRRVLGASATRMLLQVHDELVFEMKPDEEGLIEPIRKAMEDALPLDVPIEVDVKIGANWAEMVAVGRERGAAL